WRPGLAKSKPVNSGMLSTSVANATSSDSQRAAEARWLPSASTSPPPIIGSQINRLSRGQFDTCSYPWRSAPVADQRGQEHDQAENHREGAVVEEPGLGAPQHAREQVDKARAAVDEGTIDHLLVGATRQLAQQHAAAGQALDPQVVHAVLV